MIPKWSSYTQYLLSGCVRVLEASWAIMGYSLYLLWLENHYHCSHPYCLACHHCCLTPPKAIQSSHHFLLFIIVWGSWWSVCWIPDSSYNMNQVTIWVTVTKVVLIDTPQQNVCCSCKTEQMVWLIKYNELRGLSMFKPFKLLTSWRVPFFFF